MNKDRLYLNEKEICCLLLGGAGVLGDYTYNTH